MERNARAGVERRSLEKRETRGASPVSCLQSRAWSFTCLRRQFCSTDQEKRETARSLHRWRHTPLNEMRSSVIKIRSFVIFGCLTALTDRSRSMISLFTLNYVRHGLFEYDNLMDYFKL